MGVEDDSGIVRNIKQELLCDFMAGSFSVELNTEKERENFNVRG